MSHELSCYYDTRKSFYGKANIIEENGIKTLRSYQTDVAYIKNGKAFVKGQYSATTTRHIKEFLQQNGFEIGTISQILKKYIINNKIDCK